MDRRDGSACISDYAEPKCTLNRPEEIDSLGREAVAKAQFSRFEDSTQYPLSLLADGMDETACGSKFSGCAEGAHGCILTSNVRCFVNRCTAEDIGILKPHCFLEGRDKKK